MVLAKDSEGTYICGIDLEKKELSDKRTLDSLENQYISEGAKVAFAEDGFVYCMGNGLYRYDYDKGGRRNW